MKTIFRHLFIVFAFITSSVQAQEKAPTPKSLGVKAGLNYIHVTSLESVNTENKTGFMAGLYFAPPARNFGYRTELLFSRQGYDYKTNTATGTVTLDYLLLPQLMTLQLGKYLQFQAGGQMGLLINAGVDSTGSRTGSSPEHDPMDFFNRINYGFGGGVEIMPTKRLLIGARYNLFIRRENEEQSPSMMSAFIPDYVPRNEEEMKNGLLQLYIGLRF